MLRGYFNLYKKNRPEQPISRILSPIQIAPNRITIIHLWMPVARHLLQPTRKLGRAALSDLGLQNPKSNRFSIWSCTGWGLQSFPGHPGNWCALTAPFHPYLINFGLWIRNHKGGIFSVALSFTLPRLRVTEHPALRCSDFPPDHIRPSDRSDCSNRSVYGCRFTVYGLRLTVYGLQFTVYSLRFTVYSYRRCQLSTVNRQPSTVNCQLSTVNRQLSTVNRQPSTVNRQPSTVNCQPSTANRQPPTVNRFFSQ